MSRVKVPRHQRLVLVGESWESYTRLGEAFRDRPSFRLTYDRGVVELVTVTHEHENLAMLLARLVLSWTEERGLPLKSGGSTTFKRRDMDRGLEPDECSWIANEPAVGALDRIDLRRDPPPDLVIEVEVTRSSLPRLPIYAALGFPEIWRLAGTVLSFHLLQPDETYATIVTSQALTPLKPSDLMPFLALRGQIDENAIVGQFRAWVRQLPK